MSNEKLQAELEAEVQAGTIKRDSKGRYVPGNPGGPGRPPLTHSAFFDAMQKHLTPQALDEIVLATVEAAKCGDARARATIFKLLTSKQESLRDWEMSLAIWEHEAAQERIDAKYKLRDGKDPSIIDLGDFGI